MNINKSMVQKTENQFLYLLEEGLKNQFLNGHAINVYNNFLEEMNDYCKENHNPSVFNQEVRDIHYSLTKITRSYNENNPNHEISSSDIRTIACGALYKPNSPLEDVLGLESPMLPKKINSNKTKTYNIPLDDLEKKTVHLLKYA